MSAPGPPRGLGLPGVSARPLPAPRSCHGSTGPLREVGRAPSPPPGLALRTCWGQLERVLENWGGLGASCPLAAFPKKLGGELRRCGAGNTRACLGSCCGVSTASSR